MTHTAHERTVPLCFFLDEYPPWVYYSLVDTPVGYVFWEESDMNNETNAPESCCASHVKIRSEEDKKALISRLNRIEGQIRGIRGMVEKDAYCIDIITQASAAGSALNSFSKELLGEHIKSCVAEDVRNGNNEKLDELVKTLQKLMK